MEIAIAMAALFNSMSDMSNDRLSVLKLIKADFESVVSGHIF